VWNPSQGTEPRSTPAVHGTVTGISPCAVAAEPSQGIACVPTSAAGQSH